MFRLNAARMPEDPSFQADLNKLGYFIDENFEIKTIKPPHRYHTFSISNNDRVNEARGEAVHECIRREIIQRMTALGIPPVYLPQLTSEKPEDEPAVPILVTNKDELKKRKRVIVVVNDDFQDLGLWAYRVCGKEGGIEAGSALSLAKAIQGQDTEESMAPGLVVLNPGQLLYSYRLKKAVTKASWDSQPRQSAVHHIPKIDPLFNRIEGHRTIDEHVKTAFEGILKNPEWVAPSADIYLVGIGNGGDAVLRLLSNEWSAYYKGRVAAIALTDPTPVHTPIEDQDFTAFLCDRARALVPSTEPFSTPVAVPGQSAHSSEWGIPYYPMLSSGGRMIGETIFPAVYEPILAWFETIATSPDYRNPAFQVPEPAMGEGLEGAQVFDKRVTPEAGQVSM